jgi:hypothetical protein
MDVPIRRYMKRVFRITVEMFIVAGILRIHGAPGWTVWALSGDQRIQHVFNAQRGSIDVSYTHVRMNCYLFFKQSQLGVTSM